MSIFCYKPASKIQDTPPHHQPAVSGWNSNLRCSLSRRPAPKIFLYFLGTRLQFQTAVLSADLEKSAGWWGGVSCSPNNTIFFQTKKCPYISDSWTFGQKQNHFLNFFSFSKDVYRTFYNWFPPSKNIWIYSSVKIVVTPPLKDALMIIFLCHFHSENVSQGTIERVYIQAKAKCTYLGKYIPHKIAKFCFLRIGVLI